MPRPSRDLGFFKLERSGDRVTEPSNVEPFDTLVTVVFIDTILPCPFELAAYGLPDESVIDTDVPVFFFFFFVRKESNFCYFDEHNLRLHEKYSPLPGLPSRKPGLLYVVAGAADISTGSVGSPPVRSANITSYKAETAKPIDSTTSTIC